VVTRDVRRVGDATRSRPSRLEKTKVNALTSRMGAGEKNSKRERERERFAAWQVLAPKVNWISNAKAIARSH